MEKLSSHYISLFPKRSFGLSHLVACLFCKDRSPVEADHMRGRLVAETLVPLPKDRKCFRLTNGVLVERTVEDVLPALKTNSDGLKQVLEDLLKQYKSKQDEMDKWKVCLPVSLRGLPARCCHTLLR